MIIDKIVGFVAYMKKRGAFNKLKQYKYDPETIQRKVLAKIIADNQQTEYGKTYGFSDIHSVEDFQQKVPVKTSAQYLPYLTRVYQGESNVLTFEDPYYFAMTTGSTGDYKRIPITKTFRSETDKTVLAFVHMLEQAFPQIKSNAIQFLVGSGDGGHSPSGVPQGFVSGFNYKQLPKAITNRFVIPYWVFTMENAEDRYYAMARFMIDSPNLVAIGAISPLNITNVAKSIEQNLDRLIFDIQHQKLTLSADNQALADKHSFDTDNTKLKVLQAYHHNQPIDELMQKLLPCLKVLVTWCGGNMSYSLAETQQYFGKKEFFEMPFSASEGAFSVPYAANVKGGYAGISGHFLEFIPEAEIDEDDPTVLPVWQLEIDKTYYQVITTSGGLYRYNMEDLIIVSGFWGKVPILEFVSKRARQVSITNERITEKDVTDVTAEVCQQLAIRFDYFVYFPSRERYYTVVVDDEPTDMQMLAETMDEALRKMSVGYNLKRKDLLLEPIRIAVVDKVELSDYVKGHQFKSNLPSGQFKPLHLSNEFDGQKTFKINKVYTAGEQKHEPAAK